MKKEEGLETAGTILARALQSAHGTPANSATDCVFGEPQAKDQPLEISHFDFDLAEFPLFRFHKNSRLRQNKEPLVHSDTITGKDGKPVHRSWKVVPGHYGFGGQSTQVLLYDLLQLYLEQGAQGAQIQFGTLRSLLLRRGARNPSRADYDRIRRDFDILCGYYFECKNAYWDRKRQAYVDMNWRLFNSVFFFRRGPEANEELPFGFIEASTVLQAIAKTRGFFALGFSQEFFHDLKPLEQRLAIYLAKHFTSQTFHRRYVLDLAKILPIEAKRPTDVRAIVQQTAQGLLDKKLPILASFALQKSTGGEWLTTFHRGVVARNPYRMPNSAAVSLTPQVGALVDRIAEATGNHADRLWWSRCVEVLGAGAVDRALGLLKESRSRGTIHNPGGLLTKIFKDIAAEYRVSLN